MTRAIQSGSRPAVIFCQDLSAVARAIDVGMRILARAEHDVRGARVVVRGFDGFDLAILRQTRRRDVMPGLRGVARGLDQAVGGAGPHDVGADWAKE